MRIDRIQQPQTVSGYQQRVGKVRTLRIEATRIEFSEKHLTTSGKTPRETEDDLIRQLLSQYRQLQQRESEATDKEVHDDSPSRGQDSVETGLPARRTASRGNVQSSETSPFEERIRQLVSSLIESPQEAPRQAQHKTIYQRQLKVIGIKAKGILINTEA